MLYDQKSYYFPKISSTIGWLKNIKNNFSTLLRLIKFNTSSQLVRYQVKNILVYILIYPLLRVIWGKQKAENICNSFLKFDPLILSLPPPLKSKIIIFSEPLIYDEIYLKDIYHCNILKEGMNVVDVGAHIGTYTVIAAEKVGANGNIIAIEPEIQNYRRLIENIRLNNFKNVITENIALADHEGVEKLYLHFLPGKDSLVMKEGSISSREVRVKTLDTLLREIGFNKIDVIKIDTEGAEMLILKGAEKTLKENPKAKIIVASYHYPSEIKEVTDFLNKRGFKTKITKDGIVMTL
jgi:FkbM family methyltransferase